MEVGARNKIIEYIESFHYPNQSTIWKRRYTIFPSRTIIWRDWANIRRLYGLGFARSMHLARGTLLKLSRLPETIPIRNIYLSMQQLDAADSLWWTPSAYLRSKWITGKFLDEYATASIRTLFGQNNFESNAYYLSQSLNLLIPASFRLKGGNCKLIEGMIAASLADVHHLQQVVEITKSANDSSTITFDLERKSRGGRSVFLIASSLQLLGRARGSRCQTSILPAVVEYTQMHVTHFLSPFDLNPQTFKLKNGDHFPDEISLCQ